MESYVVLTEKLWNEANFRKRFGGRENWFLCTSTKMYAGIFNMNPRYVFVPHWSWKIPPKIYENIPTVIFHMTPLPVGRGWEPLQHLIMRGNKDTVVSAIQCVEEIDAGNIYLQRPMSLYGSAEEIYMRCSDIVFDMIKEIAEKELKAETPQVGEPVYFEKWTEKDYRLPDTDELNKVYDTIRMMDAYGYPKCFVEIGNLRLEFERAMLRNDCVEADVKIKQKGSGNEQ